MRANLFFIAAILKKITRPRLVVSAKVWYEKRAGLGKKKPAKIVLIHIKKMIIIK